jgi:hypothetical protein
MKVMAMMVFSLVVMAMGTRAASAAGPQKPEELAQKSGEVWLALVDAGKSAESWDEAAAYFRNAVTKEKWINAMKSVREPLGTVKSRKLQSAKYSTTLPGAPDGEDVVLKYDTSFEKKDSAVETITMALDKDGKWRVVGYYIR